MAFSETFLIEKWYVTCKGCGLAMAAIAGSKGPVGSEEGTTSGPGTEGVGPDVRGADPVKPLAMRRSKLLLLSMYPCATVVLVHPKNFISSGRDAELSASVVAALDAENVT